MDLNLDNAALSTLPETHRKDAIIKLMRSLPRYQLSDVHAELTTYLQRDILGALPREIALNVFLRLDTESLLKCGLVNKEWNGLVNDQNLWHSMCTSSHIVANTSTTWQDVFTNRDRLLLDDASSEWIDRSTPAAAGDEGWDDENEDEIVASSSTGYGGIRRDVRERSTFAGLPSTSGGWITESLSPRRPSFQLARKSTQLPLFLLPAGPSPTKSMPGPAGHGKKDSLSARTNTPILSHMSDPQPKPKVSYKHLYLVHEILHARFLRGAQRPRVLDSKASLMAGGLEGHREGIYCLQLFNHELSVPAMASVPGQECAEPKPRSIEGRQWILSGSRDKTIRLWDARTSRVVKVYTSDPSQEHQGHTGSVLTLYARPAERGGRMVSGGSDGRLVAWDLESGKVEGSVQACARGESVLCVRFDEERIVCCSKDRSIRTFDAKTLQPLLVIGGPLPNVGAPLDNNGVDEFPPNDEVEGHRAAVNAVSLTSRYIISASGDRTLRIWNALTGELLLKLEAHARGIASLDVDDRTGTIVTGSSDWGIRRFEMKDYGMDFSPVVKNGEDEVERLEKLQIKSGGVGTTYDPGLEFRAGCGCCSATRSRFDGSLDTESISSRSAVCLNCGKRAHSDLVRALWLGERVVVSGSYDSTIKIWDRNTGLLITDLSDVHTGRIFCVVGDKTKIVSSGIDQRIVIWDFAPRLDTSFVRA